MTDLLQSSMDNNANNRYHHRQNATQGERKKVNNANGSNVSGTRAENGAAIGNFLTGPTSFLDFILGFYFIHIVNASILGMLTQLARRYMFINAAQKAIAYLVIVAALSLIAEVFYLPKDWYIVQVSK